jgi:dolichol-phosphate mannosyltransferase
MTSPSLSVILPAYNEKENIERAVKDASKSVGGLAENYEIVAVDDGSKDETGAILDRLELERQLCLKVVHHPRNLGYGAALRTGFQTAMGQCIFYTDSDNQFDLTELHSFLPLMEDWDAVLGYRLDRKDPFLRRFVSNCYNLLACAAFGMSVRDLNCSFKLFRREVIKSITLESDNFFVDTELVARLHGAGWRYTQKGVPHYPRTGGQSTVRLSDVPRTFLALARMRLRLGRAIPRK